jgi:ABC-2 type transport system permease protein
MSPEFRGAGRVVAVRTAHQAARTGGLWGLAFGAYVAASSVGYASAYPNAASRARVARSLGGNTGLAALLGPVRHIDTVAGFTAWRTMGVLTTVGAIVMLLSATRLLRGEEDAGRWECYLSGRTTRGRAAGQAVVGLGAGIAALWAGTTVLTVAAGSAPKVGFPVRSSLYLSTCLVAGAAMFAAVGALVSELAASRRQANGLGAGVIGALYGVRLVADSSSGGAWLRWLSPLGWIEQLHPLTGSHPLAFVPIVGLTVAAALGAATLAAGRDLGASALPSHDTPRSRTALLGGPTGLAVRLIRTTALGWAAGVAAFGLVIGVVAQSAAGAAHASPAFQKAIARLGGHGSGVRAYVGIALSTGAALVALAAANQVSALRAEEASQRLDHLLVRPVSRARWLLGRLAVATAVLGVISVLCSLGSWLGTATQGTGLGLGEMVLAGINLAPPAIVVLGVGVLAYGLLPRRAAWAAYAVVAWSFLAQLLATVITSNRLLIDSSVLSHVTPAPAADPNWAAAGGLVVVGALAAACGLAALQRRDLAGE